MPYFYFATLTLYKEKYAANDKELETYQFNVLVDAMDAMREKSGRIVIFLFSVRKRKGGFHLVEISVEMYFLRIP